VRSPLPNNVPSTRSAPASRPSSVAATPVPRSLWVCSEIKTLSRSRTWRPNHSIWSACTLGVAHSTVAGRLRITFFSGVGRQTSMTAWQTSSANSSSVSENDSGEYWSEMSVSGKVGIRSRIKLAPSTAICRIWSRVASPNVIRRCSGEVEL